MCTAISRKAKYNVVKLISSSAAMGLFKFMFWFNDECMLDLRRVVKQKQQHSIKQQ